MSVQEEEYLGPLDGDEITVCPACGAKAWSLCLDCGWRQWTPPDDPDRRRDEASAREYGRLVDGPWLYEWGGLLADVEDPVATETR